MAKRSSQKKQKSRSPRTPGSGYKIRFSFPSSGKHPVSPEFISDFSQKIKHENASRGGCIQEEYPSPEEYVVLLHTASLEKIFNPNEFFNLPLPADSREKVFYEICFHGKNSVERAGLIIPADAWSYIREIGDVEQSADPAFADMVLQKLDFEQKEVTIRQETPLSDPSKKRVSPIERIRFQLAWNTLLPVKEAKASSLKKLFFTRDNPLFRLAFLLTALLIFIILPILSRDAGLSGDDEKHYQHAQKVYRYYTEDDPAALDDPKNKLNFYGQSFDFFTYLIIRAFNMEENPYEARHAMVAITGAAAILVTGLLVKLLAGYPAGLLAMILMFFSPRFLGHAFNNPLDIPFLLGNVFTLYHLILFLKKLPRISVRSAIWIAIGIGWTNGIRIGGLLLIPYVFMFAGLYLLIHPWPWKFFSASWWRFAIKGLITLILIVVAGYLISLLTWPYALQDIINHPIKAFKVMTNIQVSLRVLYDGLIHWSDKLPWHYIPQNILITVPAIVLLGLLASLLTLFLDRKKKMAYWYFMFWFTILFPVIFIVFRESNVYGGWRHMMFIYPSMIALSAMALTSLATMGRKKWNRWVVALLIAAGLFHPVKHTILNHPNTYIYFNELSGGIGKTYGKFETDYYTNSLKPASDYFIESILPDLESSPGEPIKVVSNASIDYYFRDTRDKVKTSYSRYYDRGRKDWDYAILYCNFLHPYQLQNGLWPPKNTVHEIKVDDVVVAAIVERQNRDGMEGSLLLAKAVRQQDRGLVSEAIVKLENAIRYDEHNEAAYLELGNAYSALLRFGEARFTMDRLLEFYPDYDKALNIKGYTYLIEYQVNPESAALELAIMGFNETIRSNHKFYTGYYNLGLAYSLKDDKNNAVYNLKQAIRFNGKFKPAYTKLAEVYEQYGEKDLAHSVREQMKRIP